MNRRKKPKCKMALTISAIFYFFIILLSVIVISFVIVTMLAAFGKIPMAVNGHPSPKYVLIVMSVISLSVGIVIIGISSHMVSKHINRVIAQMNRLSSGDFKARLHFAKPLNRHPTFREIENSFNLMAEELEHTEMLRNDFINNFSHEFKTPIVSIAGFAKLLKYGKLTEEQRIEYLDVIEEESLRLSVMATNVLNMSKVENQMILTDISRFNLSEQIRASVLLLEKSWTKKNIEFSLEFEEYEIEANEELLKQVWINLLDNAIKFSPEYGLIVVKITDNKEDYIVMIANCGCEIPQEKRKKIFDKFYQIDESHSSEGNGIGLAIVKKVTQLHCGQVSVECQNGITEFEIKLPKDLKRMTEQT